MDESTKRYWKSKKKMEQQFHSQLEELRKDLNNQFKETDYSEDVCYQLFERIFPEYYHVIEG